MADSRDLPDHLRSPLVDRVPGLALVAVLVLGGLGLLTALRAPEGRPSVRTGAWATEVERSIDERVPWRDPSVTAWGIAEFVLFGNGRPGVVVGRDGWLYTAEEFATPADGAANQARKLEIVSAVHAYLQQRGVRLVVLVVPAKARIHPEHCRTRWPAAAADRYDTFRAGLEARGILAPDLASMMVLGARKQPVYNRTDTHWTPHGADIAAQLVASRASFPSKGSVTYRRVDGEPAEHEGDLRAFVPLGPLADRLPSDTVRPYTSEGGAGAGLFGNVAIPVSLVGTSYSAEDAWSFEHALRIRLGADVLDASAEGGGPVVPMLEYLADPSFHESPPELVVWEFPERYLPTADDLAGHSEVLSELGLKARD